MRKIRKPVYLIAKLFRGKDTPAPLPAGTYKATAVDVKELDNGNWQVSFKMSGREKT